MFGQRLGWIGMVGYVKAWQSWWGGVMRGDVRFGRVRFVWAWGGSLVEVR